jgi:hemerythrin
MPYLEWKDALSIGIKSIDEQHQQLVALVNDLHDAAQAGDQRPALALVQRDRKSVV